MADGAPTVAESITKAVGFLTALYGAGSAKPDGPALEAAYAYLDDVSDADDDDTAYLIAPVLGIWFLAELIERGEDVEAWLHDISLSVQNDEP